MFTTHTAFVILLLFLLLMPEIISADKDKPPARETKFNWNTFSWGKGGSYV